MKSAIRVLDSSGASVHTFDLTEKAAQQEAEALIRRLREDGRLIYRLNPETGEGTEKVTGLAELGEENVAIPRIVGG